MQNWLFQNYHTTPSTYQAMLELNPDLAEISGQEVVERIDFLKNLGLSDNIIKNTVESNSLIFSRSLSDLNEIIQKLQEIGLTDIIDLIDANPFILNLDTYEIDRYIKEKMDSGESFEDIVDSLEEEPARFFDI